MEVETENKGSVGKGKSEMNFLRNAIWIVMAIGPFTMFVLLLAWFEFYHWLTRPRTEAEEREYWKAGGAL